MPEYDSIPGVYTSRPRQFTSVRRFLRPYMNAMVLFLMLLLIIALASGITLLISDAVVGDEENAEQAETGNPPANESMVNLLSIPWPRRDEHWYENRWESTMKQQNETTTPQQRTTREVSQLAHSEMQSQSSEILNHALRSTMNPGLDNSEIQQPQSPETLKHNPNLNHHLRTITDPQLANSEMQSQYSEILNHALRTTTNPGLDNSEIQSQSPETLKQNPNLNHALRTTMNSQLANSKMHQSLSSEILKHNPNLNHHLRTITGPQLDNSENLQYQSSEILKHNPNPNHHLRTITDPQLANSEIQSQSSETLNHNPNLNHHLRTTTDSKPGRTKTQDPFSEASELDPITDPRRRTHSDILQRTARATPQDPIPPDTPQPNHPFYISQNTQISKITLTDSPFYISQGPTPMQQISQDTSPSHVWQHPTDPESPEWMVPDGSTYPENDTWHWNRRPNSLPLGREEEMSNALAEGDRAQKVKEELERTLRQLNITLAPNTAWYRHQHSFGRASHLAMNMSKLGYAMNKASSHVGKSLNLTRGARTFDSQWLGDISSSPYCEIGLLRSHPHPCPSLPYRSIDGTCNNLNKPVWGASYTAFRRMMPPEYGDGISSVRQSHDGQELPNPREVSTKVHTFKRSSSRSYSVLTMSFGQFLDHDITLTAMSKGQAGSSISCCDPEVTKNGSLSHPECMPIRVPPKDALYTRANTSCLEFVRSAPAAACKFGPRQQINQQTSYIDGSGIYGSSLETANSLRTGENGLLKTQVTLDGRQLLPASRDLSDGCNKEEKLKYNQTCFRAGDPRVNEQILLTSLHTVFARHHNTLAIQLRDLNPNWQDERLYQEARKIVIAQLQHVTYEEYVPSIIGPKLMAHLGLSPKGDGQHTHDYDPNISPSISNEFAAAAFRFGHSQIQGLVQLIDGPGKNIEFTQLSSITFNPFALYEDGKMASYLRGETSQKAAAVDTYFTPQVTGKLFASKGGVGLDLVATNIQRGRDHGIPSYTRARMACGLPLVKNFTDLQMDLDGAALRKIQKVYRHVQDIDLYTGGLAEKPVEDGLVGPTFACIIGDQFLRLKRGDRFWYEEKDELHGFNKDQLAQIHKTSLARILCDNIPELSSIQRWPLRLYSTLNPRLPCSSSSIPRVYLGDWEEGGMF